MTDTLTMTPILSGCCGEFYAVEGDRAECLFCLNPVSVAADILPYMDEGETLVSQSHPSGVSVLGYVTREGE